MKLKLPTFEIEGEKTNLEMIAAFEKLAVDKYGYKKTSLHKCPYCEYYVGECEVCFGLKTVVSGVKLIYDLNKSKSFKLFEMVYILCKITANVEIINEISNLSNVDLYFPNASMEVIYPIEVIKPEGLKELIPGDYQFAVSKNKINGILFNGKIKEFPYGERVWISTVLDSEVAYKLLLDEKVTTTALNSLLPSAISMKAFMHISIYGLKKLFAATNAVKSDQARIFIKGLRKEFTKKYPYLFN